MAGTLHTTMTIASRKATARLLRTNNGVNRQASVSLPMNMNGMIHSYRQAQINEIPEHRRTTHPQRNWSRCICMGCSFVFFCCDWRCGNVEYHSVSLFTNENNAPTRLFSIGYLSSVDTIAREQKFIHTSFRTTVCVVSFGFVYVFVSILVDVASYFSVFAKSMVGIYGVHT